MNEKKFNNLKDLYTFQESLIFVDSKRVFHICRDKKDFVLLWLD